MPRYRVRMRVDTQSYEIWEVEVNSKAEAHSAALHRQGTLIDSYPIDTYEVLDLDVIAEGDDWTCLDSKYVLKSQLSQKNSEA